MLLLVAGAGDIFAIADRLHRMRVKVEKMEVCPLSPKFWDGLGAIYEDLYLHMAELEKAASHGNYLALFAAREGLKKVEAESKALEKVIKDKCSPFLASGNELYAECACPGGTCSGLFCKCTSDGGCWAIFGNTEEKDKNEGYAPMNKNEKASSPQPDRVSAIYDVSGRIVGTSLGTLKHGIYFVKYSDGSFRRVIVR